MLDSIFITLHLLQEKYYLRTNHAKKIMDTFHRIHIKVTVTY